jgi:prolipoprotein diacylglyceryltransferase
MQQVDNEMEKKQKQRKFLIFVLWVIVGVMLGGLLGFLMMKGYIQDYTNECIELYNQCKENCSNLYQF